ncbi:MAG: CBS domain-containing protein [Acidobacteriota bacterium]
MNCPDCGHENIAGTEICDECGHDLAGLDLPVATTHLQKKIMEDPLENLHPAAPLLISPDTLVTTALAKMQQERYGCIFVTEGDRLIGILTERDVLMKLVGQTDLSKLTVRNVMTPDPETLTEQDTVAYALNKMSVGGYRHIPIMRGNQPIGMVSVRGILRYISNHLL